MSIVKRAGSVRGRTRPFAKRSAAFRSGRALPAIAAVLLSLGCSRETLETRTYELNTLEPHEAREILEPYVYVRESEVRSGAISTGQRVITVREEPENLDRIEEVLARVDRPGPHVTLRFQFVEANGFEGTDPAIADVEEELRRLLRFEGYQVRAQTVLRGRVGREMSQQVDLGFMGGEFSLEAWVHLAGHEDNSAVELFVNLKSYYGQDRSVIQTTVTVQDGQATVLGTSAPAGFEGEALILVVRPEIEPDTSSAG